MIFRLMQSGAFRLYRVLPGAVRIIPFPITKAVTRALFSQAREFDQKEDRQWIVNSMMPAIARQKFRKVVFVGTAAYTFHYEKAFRGTRTEYITIDPVPGARVWGAKHHIVDRLENIGRYIELCSVDAVVFIGCYEFGTSEREMILAVEATHRILREGGVFIWSHNRDVSRDPSDMPVFDALYRHEAAIGLPARKEFDEAMLVVHIHVKKGRETGEAN